MKVQSERKIRHTPRHSDDCISKGIKEKVEKVKNGMGKNKS